MLFRSLGGLVLTPAIASAAIWGANASVALRIQRIVAKAVKFDLGGVVLPPLNVDVSMTADGAPQSITLTGLTDQGSGSAIDLAGGGTTATGSLTTTLTGGGSYVNTATADATNATAQAQREIAQQARECPQLVLLHEFLGQCTRGIIR